jgi:hypothetical protein
MLANIVDGNNIGVAQVRSRYRFALKTLRKLGIDCQLRR